ncbi:MAG: sulfate ABC transporter permease subunit CysT [Chloroflexi bacterium]|nr:sulfate ABC transporter permease subunit CysT [Chloroflexota bacterium]
MRRETDSLQRRARAALRHAPLGGAFVSAYLTVVVLIPIAALVAQAGGAFAQGGGWAAVTNPQTLAALELTISTAVLVALANAVVGLATAWVLVRDDFPGRRLLDAIIDLPLALPTIVAGVTLLTLYGPGSPIGLNIAYTRAAITLALLFVTFPFVVRSVQPVLQVLDPEVEAAARSMGAGGWTLFRHILLPQLMPAVISGAALAFARGLGEYGAVVLLSGNIPFQTQLTSVYIFGDVEQGDTADAAAISLVLLLLTLAVLVAADVFRRRYTANAQ